MEIRAVDVFDDEEFAAWFHTLRAAELHERPGMPFWANERDAQVVFQAEDPTETQTPYTARDGELVVGAGVLGLIHNSNLDKAFLTVGVPPEHRGRGIGTALEAELARLAAAQGRTALVAESHIPAEHRDDHPYRRFAEARGYALANVEVGRQLPLPVQAADLDRWEAESAPHHVDYRVETFVDDVPEQLLESFCDLYGQLALEAPTGDLDFEAEVITVESFRLHQEQGCKRGLTVYFTLAISPDDEVVACSVLAVPRDEPGNVYQWATLVRRGHRGHRLGMATKVRNMRTMQAAHPDRTRVLTRNAEVNRHMVAINERIGFTPLELVAEFQRFVPAETATLVGAVSGANPHHEE